MAEDAIKHKKIFCMETNHSAVRRRLQTDGWVENLEYNPKHQRLAKEEGGLRGIISRLVRNQPVNFVWTATRRKRCTNDAQQILAAPAYLNFNTKSTLAQIIRNIAVVTHVDPDAVAPRAYRMHREKEANLFYRDFILTACVNILKYATGFMHGNRVNSRDFSVNDWVPLKKQGLPTRFPLSVRLQEEKLAEFDIAEETYDCYPEPPTEAVKEWLKRDINAVPVIDMKKIVEVKKFPDEVLRTACQHISEFLAIADEIIYQPRLKKLKFAMAPTHNSWNMFLNWSYLVRHPHIQKLELEDTAALEEKMVYYRSLLGSLLQLHPPAAHDGVSNVWIVKPGSKSRGQEITVCDTVEEVTEICFNNQGFPDMRNFVVQKYIERPFLCHKTKFDIREWFLVTWHPLALWLYNDCYLRFSSAHYTLNNFDEKIHLTNNAIQGKYFHRLPPDSRIPKECMWKRDEFIQYLSCRGMNGSQLWHGKILPEITRLLKVALIASSTEMDMKAVDGYELFGADFVLSEDLKPWLIEINSGPDLSASTQVTATLCPELIMDSLKVLIDHQRNREASTGKFKIVHEIHYARQNKPFRERSGPLESMKPIRRHRMQIAKSRGLVTSMPPTVSVSQTPEGVPSYTYDGPKIQNDISGHYASAPSVQEAVKELRREKAMQNFCARKTGHFGKENDRLRGGKSKGRMVSKPTKEITRKNSDSSSLSSSSSEDSDDDDQGSLDEDDEKGKNEARRKETSRKVTAIKVVVPARKNASLKFNSTGNMSAMRKLGKRRQETVSDKTMVRMKVNNLRLSELARPKLYPQILLTRSEKRAKNLPQRLVEPVEMTPFQDNPTDNLQPPEKETTIIGPVSDTLPSFPSAVSYPTPTPTPEFV